MHELTIAYKIVEIVTRTAQKERATGVDSIHLEVGTISGVEINALEFSLNIAKKETLLENAVVNIMRIDGKARCKECLTIFEVDDLYSSCPICGKYSREIIAGKEIRVTTIDIN